MKSHSFLALAALALLPACAQSTTAVPSRTSEKPELPQEEQAQEELAQEEPAQEEPARVSVLECKPTQFVGCASGEACARKQGVLVNAPSACFDRAADACTSLSCAHGCDIYHGAPLEIHCAPGASSSGNMKRCGGYSNWACPENMRCDLGPDGEKVDDASGTCVPSAPN